MERIVLDTNCLVSSLSRTSKTYDVWRGLYEGRYVLCLSNDILLEYLEIIGQKTTPQIAENVIQFLLNCEYVELVTPFYHFELITADHDDNKFVDCAMAANATYIVSDDKHYNPLKLITYPNISVISLMDFVRILRNGK